jgi:ribulose-phosphate 3-epimerase
MSESLKKHPMKGPIIAPSILSADFTRLAEEVKVIDPWRDWVHCDVMDLHFVPNLTFGPIIVGAVHKLTPAFVDVHLMIELTMRHPERVFPMFREAGAHQITIHLEAGPQPAALLNLVRGTGARVGLALKPGTPIAAADPYLHGLDVLLVMTVEPGFGGQAFMDDMLRKVDAAALRRERAGARFLIEVDGGIAPDTAVRCLEAGADVFVAGHSIYRQPRPAEALAALRQAVA